jgi:hypothetical protein
MDSYKVTYKVPGFFSIPHTLRGVVGDGFIVASIDLPISQDDIDKSKAKGVGVVSQKHYLVQHVYRFFQLEDGSLVHIPFDSYVKFHKERSAAIEKDINRQARGGF